MRKLSLQKSLKLFDRSKAIHAVLRSCSAIDKLTIQASAKVGLHLNLDHDTAQEENAWLLFRTRVFSSLLQKWSIHVRCTCEVPQSQSAVREGLTCLLPHVLVPWIGARHNQSPTMVVSILLKALCLSALERWNSPRHIRK